VAKAIWNGKVIAASDDVEPVEGNLYFPATSVRQEYLRPSPTTTERAWKGTTSYYTVVVDGEEIRDAAWYYRDPKPAAARIKGRIAFGHDIEIEEQGLAATVCPEAKRGGWPGEHGASACHATLCPGSAKGRS